MLFPIGDENPARRTPYVTYGLIAANVLIFLGTQDGLSLKESVLFEYGYTPSKGAWYTILTSMFLHGNLMHLLGNMWFLWIVGDNVEDKLGHVAYVGFYLFTGIVAVLFYLLFLQFGAADIPLVGASGAISGVLGCYMLFFPNARIRIFYWVFFFFVGVMAVRAKWVIGAWVAMQLLNWAATHNEQLGGVAFAAHVGGFAAGVAIALAVRGVLTRKGILGDSDLLGSFREEERPRARTIDGGWPRPTFVNPRMETERQGEGFFGIEEAIVENVKSGLLDVAVERYRDYVRMPHAKVLPAWAQLEIGGEFFRRKDYEAALEAYRRYVAHYPTGPDAGEAKFRLGIILSRQRREYYRAREYLLQAAVEHPDPAIVAFARDELARIEPYL